MLLSKAMRPGILPDQPGKVIFRPGSIAKADKKWYNTFSRPEKNVKVR